MTWTTPAPSAEAASGPGADRRAARALRAVQFTVLAAFLWAQLAALPGEAPTVDEQNHVARGLSYLLTGDLRLRIGHPPLLNVMAALPLALDPRLRLPLDDPAWRTANWIEFAIALFWENGNPARMMIYAARVMMALLGVLGLAGLGRLAEDVGGPWAGAAGVMLVALEPNFRAHARLVTTDAGALVALALTFWLWRRWLRRPRPTLALAAGLALGAALLSKFTALLFVPPLMIAALAAWGWNGRAAGRLAFGLGVAGLATWAFYGFEARPAVGLAWPVPLATYWEEFLGTALERRARVYLLGQVLDHGTPLYFPVVLLAKAPLPLLALAAVGLTAWLRRAWRAESVLWLPAVVYFGAVTAAGVNLGYRHLFPALPLLYLGGALGLGRWALAAGPRRWAAGGLLAWLALNTLLIYPRDLTFFNEAVGGPDNGWRVLVDSNLDWGQDLDELAAFVREREIGSIYVSYFGSVPIGSFPVAEYPIPARPLPPRPAPGWQQLFPAPGWYAISVTHLMGVASLTDPDTFAFFRHRRPEAVLGRTIYVYRVPAETGAVAVCANPPPSLGEADVRRIFGSALTRLILFDCSRGLPLPRGLAWYLLRGEQAALIRPALKRLGAQLVYDEPHRSDPAYAYSLYRLEDAAGRAARYAAARPAAATFGGLATLLGHRYTRVLAPGRPAQVETVWRIEAALPEPVSFFLHLAAPDGFPLVVSDGLNTPFDVLQPGDGLIQFHPLGEYPANLPEGARFEVGLYLLTDPQTRFRLGSGEDRFSFSP